MYGADDLDQLFADDGVPCQKSGHAAVLGLKWLPEQIEEIGGPYQRLAADYGVTMKTADVAALGLQHGDALTVDGVAYQVSQSRPFDDGALTVVILSRA